jgi:predicted PhzF superfamily epimerase YddE/YHI9
MTAIRAWLGRVFPAPDGSGGNHTAVVWPGLADAELVPTARALAVPDTGFLLEIADRRVRLRTFSPVEELAQCVQTALAATVALDTPEGGIQLVTQGPGTELEVFREEGICWSSRPQQGRPDIESVGRPSWLPAAPDRAVRLGAARSRLYLSLDSAADVLVAAPTSAQVLRTCAAMDCQGVVLYHATSTSVRARVFTTSLAGGEDTATGGAVLGLGQLLAAAGMTGRLPVTQGPAEPDRQGTLWLRLDPDPSACLVGGVVVPLLAGVLAR